MRNKLIKKMRDKISGKTNYLILTELFSLRLVFSACAVLVFACVLQAQTKLRDALDFDGDDKADYLVQRTAENNWYVLRSSDNSLSAANFGINSYDTATPGDYDGDGKADIAVWRYSNGVWYRINSSNNTFSATQFGQVGDEPIARDFDGDGKTDQAVIRRTGANMTWYVLQSQSGSLRAQQFGLAADFAAPGDFDGDGKFDVAIMRPGATAGAQSSFYVYRSSDSAVQTEGWGLSGDWFVPGDYDGDNKTDFAVVRRAAAPGGSLTWYILKSSDRSLLAYSFGVTQTDAPVQNDYDGDGKTDVGVWRETDGVFYVLKSSNASVGATNWGLISDLPIAAYDTH